MSGVLRRMSHHTESENELRRDKMVRYRAMRRIGVWLVVAAPALGLMVPQAALAQARQLEMQPHAAACWIVCRSASRC